MSFSRDEESYTEVLRLSLKCVAVVMRYGCLDFFTSRRYIVGGKRVEKASEIVSCVAVGND